MNIGGEKIAAERVEAVLASFNGVREAATFVATNKVGIQEVWAAVVCRDNINAEDLRTYCRPRMPSHFVPAHIVNLDALPMSAMGKVIRPRLKEIVTGAVRSS